MKKVTGPIIYWKSEMTDEVPDALKSAQRVARLDITPEFILTLEQGIFEVTHYGLPSDSRRVGAGYDERTDNFYLLLVSETFDLIGDGEVIPTLNPIELRRIYEDEIVMLEKVR